jgi:cytoskeleton protein RodZ
MMAAERKSADFGVRLREARERRGVSLRAIADATKISVGALEALERNDISRLPGGIFSRSFVRAYAEQVGLDPEQTIAEFITQFPHDSVTQGHPRTRSLVDELDDRPRGGATVLRVALVALLLIAAGAVYFGYAGGVGRRSPTTDGQAGAQAASASAVPATPGDAAVVPTAPVAAPVPAPAVAPAAVRPASLEVALHAVRPCVLTIRVDDEKAMVLALQPGSVHRVTASAEVALSVNDPLAIEWTINGAAARPLESAPALLAAR